LFIICDNVAEVYGQDTKPLASASDSAHKKWMHEMQAIRIDKPYPVFNFKLSNGNEVSSESLKGKVIVIDCWFQYCHPCMTEVDGLNALYDSLSKRDDVVFFTIARERPEDLPQIIKDHNIRYPVVADLQNADHYNLGGGYPAKIIVGRDGLVKYYHSGGSTMKELAWKYIMEEFRVNILAEAWQKRE
jgi:peroxiredoxin